jgi:hypothetical protein
MLSLPEAKRRGGPHGPRRHNVLFARYAVEFGVSLRRARRVSLDQLERCKDDDARRLLLRGLGKAREAGFDA